MNPDEMSAPALQNSHTTESIDNSKLQVHGFFSGPLPPPSILEGYERACPGSAEKIIQMAVDEQKHRHVMDTSSQQEEARQVRRGQIFGVIVAVATLVASVVIVVLGDSTATSVIGSVLGVGGLAAIAGAFVYSHTKASAGMISQKN